MLDFSEVPKGFYKFLQKKAKDRQQKEKDWTTYDRRYRPVRLPDGKMACSVEQYPPLFVVECYLSYCGGTFKSGMKGLSKKNVSKAGFMKNVSLAYNIMNRTKPRLTKMNWRDMLPELRRDDVVYFDPPYVGAKVSAYADDTLNHGELVTALLKTWSGFKWVLSEYEHDIYQPLTKAYGGPIRISVPKHMASTKGNKRPQAVECLWKNF